MNHRRPDSKPIRVRVADSERLKAHADARGITIIDAFTEAVDLYLSRPAPRVSTNTSGPTHSASGIRVKGY